MLTILALAVVQPAAPPRCARTPPLLAPSRRDALALGLAALATATMPPRAALAATGAPSEAELTKMAAGYARLQYLADHFEQETTVCVKGCKAAEGIAGTSCCIRDPVIIQSYLGMKSMKDPLFKADEVMLRGQELVDDKKADEYIAAVDRWVEKVDECNVMAFTSSWGATNPGGGRDNVERYLERSRKNVLETTASLKTVLTLPGAAAGAARRGRRTSWAGGDRGVIDGRWSFACSRCTA